MDAAYDTPLIKQHSKSLGYVPLIDENPVARLNWRRGKRDGVRPAIPSTFKNPPFIARIFYRRALLQRLEIAD